MTQADLRLIDSYLYDAGEIGISLVREGEGTNVADPKTGAGNAPGTNGAAAPAKEEAPKGLTQDEVNRLLHNEREKFDAKFATFRAEVSPKLAELDTVKTQNEELRKLIEERTREADRDDKDDDDPISIMLRQLEPPPYITTKEGKEQWRRMRRKELLKDEEFEQVSSKLKNTEEQLQKLTKDSEERALREAEANRNALAADRSAKIATVIASLKIPKTEDAQETMEAWLDRRVKRDESTGKLIFRVSEDEYLPFNVANVDKHLPAVLRAPVNDTGGSGGGGPTRQTPPPESVPTLEATLAKAIEAAAKQPRNDTLQAEVMRLKREIAQARKSQAA